MTAGKLGTEFKKFLTGCDPGNTFPRGHGKQTAKAGQLLWVFRLRSSGPQGWPALTHLWGPARVRDRAFFHLAQIHTHTW